MLLIQCMLSEVGCLKLVVHLYSIGVTGITCQKSLNKIVNNK